MAVYEVKRRSLVNKVWYERGDTITSEQLGRQRTERAMLSVGKIAPFKEPAPVAAERGGGADEVQAIPRNKGGRPRRT